MPFRPIADPTLYRWRGTKLPWLNRHGKVKFYETDEPMPKAIAVNEVRQCYDDPRQDENFFEWFVLENGEWRPTHIIQGSQNWLLGKLLPPRLIVMMAPRLQWFVRGLA